MITLIKNVNRIKSIPQTRIVYQKVIEQYYNNLDLIKIFRESNETKKQNEYLQKIEDKIYANSTKNLANKVSLEPIYIMNLIGDPYSHIPINSNILKMKINSFEESKCSVKTNGIVKAYAANTHQGIVRNYNEDRVSIILNIAKPDSFKGIWPKCNYFAIYDGHSGSGCCNYLRDNLHHFVRVFITKSKQIVKNEYFPSNPCEAIKRGFEIVERDFISHYAKCRNEELIDRSGSCVIILLTIGK